MSTINGRACVVNGMPVDKVFSNGRKVYGRNYFQDTSTLASLWKKGTTNSGSDIRTDPNSKTSIIHLYLGNGVTTTTGMYWRYTGSIHLIAGQQYTISAKVRYYSADSTETSTTYEVDAFSDYTLNQQGGDPLVLTGTITNVLRTYSVTFTAKATGDYSNWYIGRYNASDFPNGSLYIGEQKLEAGNKATDWSPAPEDVM